MGIPVSDLEESGALVCPEYRVFIDGPWEASTEISGSLLRADNGAFLRYGDILTIHVANGHARYRLHSYDEAIDIYQADLIESTYEPVALRPGEESPPSSPRQFILRWDGDRG